MKKLTVILIFFIILLTGCGGDKPFSKLSKNEQESFVWLMTQNIVKDKLKSPSSAKFPSQLNAKIKSLGDNKYEVTSYVEAENSFGVKLKTDFFVTLDISESYNVTQKGYGYKGECKIIE